MLRLYMFVHITEVQIDGASLVSNHSTVLVYTSTEQLGTPLDQYIIMFL